MLVFMYSLVYYYTCHILQKAECSDLVSVRPSVCAIGILTVANQGAACKVASVHFGPPVRMIDIRVDALALWSESWLKFQLESFAISVYDWCLLISLVASNMVYFMVCCCCVSYRNGHIMTHSSKKPHMCRFVGCEKSYCDARSLRRHLENHHQQAVDSSSSAASDGILTPRSATDLPSVGQPIVFNFDFVTSPGVAGQNVATDHDLTSGLSHSQSSPAISDTSQPPVGMRWLGGINPLE